MHQLVDLLALFSLLKAIVSVFELFLHSLTSQHPSLADKSVYKHVPHREKPQHLVARRNARERRRVHSVNVAFARLRRVVPGTSGWVARGCVHVR